MLTTSRFKIIATGKKKSDKATASIKNWFHSNLMSIRAENCTLVNFKNELEGQIAENIHKNKIKHYAYYPQPFHGLLLHLGGDISRYRPFPH